MKRRNFLMSLLMLPFAPKALKAEPWVPKSAKRTPEEWKSFIEREVEARFKALQEDGSLWTRLYDHKRAIEANTEAVRRNVEALRLNVPKGVKKPTEKE